MNNKARYRELQRQLLLLRAQTYRQHIQQMTTSFQMPLGLTLLLAQWFASSKRGTTSSLWKTLLSIALTASTWWKKNKG